MKVKDLIKILELHEPDDRVILEQSHSDWQNVLAIYDEGGCRSEVQFYYSLDGGFKTVKNVMLFKNGASVVCDEDGNQISALQESWFMLFLKHLEAHGVNPAAGDIDYELPGGLQAIVFAAENDYGYNWQIQYSGGKIWHTR